MSFEDRPSTCRQIDDHWYRPYGTKRIPESERIAFVKSLSDRFHIEAEWKKTIRKNIYLILDNFECDWVYCDLTRIPRKELAKREAAVRKAANALISLPSPYSDYFGGIGKHLLIEADVIREGIPPPNSKGRPMDKNKLNLLRNVYLRCAPDEPIPLPPEPPTTFQIEIAKAIYEFVTNDHTSFKNWQVLVANRFMKDYGHELIEMIIHRNKWIKDPPHVRSKFVEEEMRKLEKSLE